MSADAPASWHPRHRPQAGRGDGSEFQVLFHDLGRQEKGGNNLSIALVLATQGNKRAELDELVQGDAPHFLCKGAVLGEDLEPHIPQQLS